MCAEAGSTNMCPLKEIICVQMKVCVVCPWMSVLCVHACTCLYIDISATFFFDVLISYTPRAVCGQEAEKHSKDD